MGLKKIVFIHPFLLHYHYPRLTALADECRKIGISLYNVQLAGSVGTYHSLIERMSGNFDNQCLFPEQDLASIPHGAMKTMLDKTLEKIKPEVAYLYGYYSRAMRWAKFWTERNHVASVLISDSNYSDKFRFAPFERLKSRFVSRFDAAFVGGSSSRLYLQYLGFPQNRICAGYDVIDNDTFRNRNLRNKEDIVRTRLKWNLPEQHFLFVGRLVDSKNVRGLLGAYADYVLSIGSDPWDLVVCGDGAEERNLRDYAATLSPHVMEHVRFAGLVKQPDLIDYFSTASCFILPSKKYESWGLVVNEAMACGLPVLVSDRCGCASDLVVNGLNGYRINPDNDGELSDRMVQMHFLEFEARREMGRRGEEIISHWNLDRFCSGALESAEVAMRNLRAG